MDTDPHWGSVGIEPTKFACCNHPKTGADGEIRTLTEQGLNLLPLPEIGLHRRKVISFRERP